MRPPAALIGQGAPPWVFGLMFLPLGLFTGALTVVFPFLAARHGMSVAAIGSVIGAGMLASPMKLLWTPLVDLVGTLRGWVVASATITAVLTGCMLVVPTAPGSVAVLAALAFAAGTGVAFNQIGTSGLLALTVDEGRLGVASGYVQGGQLAALGVGGAAGLGLATRYGPAFAAVIIAIFTIASSLTILLVAEPERPHLSATANARIVSIAHDIWDMARNRRRLFVIMLFLTPIGAGAASNLFASIAGEWRAGAGTVVLVTGLGAALASAAGAFFYGHFADRLDRVASMLTAGALLVGSAALLALLPRTPSAFAAGTLIYALCLGCSYTAFSALLFETIGKGAAASKYCALNAFGNVPNAYMPVLLGLVHDRWSTTAMLWFEAGSTAGFILIFALANRTIATPRVTAGAGSALRTA